LASSTSISASTDRSFSINRSNCAVMLGPFAASEVAKVHGTAGDATDSGGILACKITAHPAPEAVNRRKNP
jgi:hypothetical protein